MIIDSHVHLLKEKNFDKNLWNANGIKPPKDTPVEDIVNWLKDNGVVKAVIMGQDMSRIWNSSCGEDYVFEMYKKYSDFFIPLASIEPINKMNRFNKESLNYLKIAIKKGFKGVLITPPYGQFCANDRRLYPIYEFAEESNIIVQFHYGAVFGPPVLAQLKYTDINNLNDLLVDFPSLKIVVEHLAFPWTEQLLILMANSENLYSDLAMLYNQPTLTAWRVVMAKEYGVIDKIMYGSDYWSSGDKNLEEPGFLEEPGLKMKEWINYIKEGINRICKKSGWPTLEPEDIKNILWKTAKRLYNLDLKD